MRASSTRCGRPRRPTRERSAGARRCSADGRLGARCRRPRRPTTCCRRRASARCSPGHGLDGIERGAARSARAVGGRGGRPRRRLRSAQVPRRADDVGDGPLPVRRRGERQPGHQRPAATGRAGSRDGDDGAPRRQPERPPRLGAESAGAGSSAVPVERVRRRAGRADASVGARATSSRRRSRTRWSSCSGSTPTCRWSRGPSRSTRWRTSTSISASACSTRPARRPALARTSGGCEPAGQGSGVAYAVIARFDDSPVVRRTVLDAMRAVGDGIAGLVGAG